MGTAVKPKAVTRAQATPARTARCHTAIMMLSRSDYLQGVRLLARCDISGCSGHAVSLRSGMLAGL